jgi:hypothetical protein
MLTVALVMSLSFNAGAEMEEEGFDKQSEQEIEAAQEEVSRLFSKEEPVLSFGEQNRILDRYAHIDPLNLVPDNLLRRALVYFDENRASFTNRNYLTIVDFLKRSNRVRLFIVNLKSGSVWPLRTTHGAGGDLDDDGYVETFSNAVNSKKSSLGFYRVGEVYRGKYGRSIRLDGLSTWNSNVRRRAIVIHGSNYVHEANVIQGRSAGCFALDWDVKDLAVDKIHGGSLFFVGLSK